MPPTESRCAGSSTPSNPIKTLLSQTGCFDTTNPTQPVAALVPYTPNAPFWSDGASKARWLALPDGQKITVNNQAFSSDAVDVEIAGYFVNGAGLEIDEAPFG